MFIKARIATIALNLMVLVNLIQVARWGWSYVPYSSATSLLSLVVLVGLLPLSHVITQWLVGSVKG